MSCVLRLFSKNCNNIWDKVCFNNLTTFKMSFYAVANGRSIGIFNTWAECESQVKGFKGAKYKKFNTREEALSFVSGGSTLAVNSNGTRNNSRQYKTVAKNTSAVVPSCSNERSFTKKCTSTNENDFDDLHDEIMKKMDEIEKDIGEIKKNTSSRTGLKRSIMIDPLPVSPAPSTLSSLKQNGDSAIESEAKRVKKTKITKGNYNFNTNDEGFVEVYTDGACSNNGYKGAQAGLGVYFGDGHPLNCSEPVSGRATNNCGEIQAATKAIRVAHSLGIAKLNIKTDSKFVINAMTKWIYGWKRKGWKLANGDPVKNEIDFKDLDNAQKLLEIKWEYVNAHKGIHGNEMADKLAKAGATKYENFD